MLIFLFHKDSLKRLPRDGAAAAAALCEPALVAPETGMTGRSGLVLARAGLDFGGEGAVSSHVGVAAAAASHLLVSRGF